MGQVLVIEIRSGEIAQVLRALRQGSFDVQQVASQVPWSDQSFRCARGRSEFRFSIYESRPGGTFVVFPYPPYTLLPWRWPSDYRLFNDVTAVFEPYEIEFAP